ncbi:aldo/keto reductase [Myxacorys almedinensis]|uniref:Aldo/keto reductase n=1 Tax=Myxacorys almedinensis A TaxID=2690445 RepID=A0A8J7Z045_9CYAN|nr:aldo/keto reductase [Myxacorys almedinensis]NDJ17259.1 aldo/keto reductase [Myxacorys almedinensis A]
MQTQEQTTQTPNLRELGRTGTMVFAIGLGEMPMSIDGRPPEDQAIATIHKALDLGVTLIDTADSYCMDESDKHHGERLVHKALQQYSGDISRIVVATKGGLMRPNGSWTRNGSPDHLRQTIRESFDALGGKKPIDLWQYHSPDPNYTIAESLQPVTEAVTEGLIRFVGVSNFSVDQIKQARSVVNVVSVQNQYNPWHRDPEVDGVLNYCESEGLSFLPWSPLGGSRRVQQLSGIDAIADLAREKSVSVYSLVLAWMLSRSSCIIPIPGASKPESIEDSVTAANVRFTEAEMGMLDSMT